jgi:cytidine deaminase
MKEIKYEFSFKVFDDFKSFSGIERKLIEKAINAMEDAYARYSNFKVGSAVLLGNGKIITGSNQENAVFPAGLCAERVALAAAKSNYPKVPVTALALSTQKILEEDEIPLFPCGICRQALAEEEAKFGNKIKLYVAGSNNKTWVVNSVRDILPFPFGYESLKL